MNKEKFNEWMQKHFRFYLSVLKLSLGEKIYFKLLEFFINYNGISISLGVTKKHGLFKADCFLGFSIYNLGSYWTPEKGERKKAEICLYLLWKIKKRWCFDYKKIRKLNDN